MGKHYQELKEEGKLFGVDKKGVPLKHLEAWQHAYLKKKIRTQFIWDIETTGFNAKRDFIVCWHGIWRDIVTGKMEKVGDHISKKDIDISVKKHKNFNFDYRILQSLSDNLRVVDQAVGHYSTKFDMPFFRTRCIVAKQPELIPDYGELVQGDTWRMCRNSMRLYRNSLDVAAYTLLGESEKTKVDSTYWMTIWFEKHQNWNAAMEYIDDHCIRDVDMTYNLLRSMEKFNSVSRTYV